MLNKKKKRPTIEPKITIYGIYNGADLIYNVMKGGNTHHFKGGKNI